MKVRSVSQAAAFALCVGWMIFGQVSRLQADIYVTDFGAQGDLSQLQNINTVSNSTTLTSPTARFAPGDVGKLVEVFNAGAWEGVSNATLFAYITTVVSPTNVTVSAPAGATGSQWFGLYGTDDRPAFLNAIAAAAVPADNIIIPTGNYFLIPPGMSMGNNDFNAIQLHRGGLTFAGQGSVTLTGVGGWVTYNNQGQRGPIFSLSNMTNDYPLVFSNLTLDGGVPVGNIQNLTWPVPGNTGEGWDGTHHWLVTGGSGSMVSSIVMQNCTVQHWRGEMMEETSGQPNVYLYATNCVFTDGDASCINNFAHNCVSCTFSNAHQAEEFYRTYSTNTSYLVNSTLINLVTGIALNGGLYTSPFYNINGNIFTNLTYALMTTPACNVLFSSNSVYCAQGVALGVAGYQGTTVNSNILIAHNLFNGTQYAFTVFGGGQNMSENIYFYSNTVANAWGIATGCGWSTNVFVYNNVGLGCGKFNELPLSGQYYNDWTNSYTPITYGDSSMSPAIVNYAYGAQANVSGNWGNGVPVGLAISSQIPFGAPLTVNSLDTYPVPVYGNASLAGPALANLPAHGTLTFYWNGSAWQTNAPGLQPPGNLRASFTF